MTDFNAGDVVYLNSGPNMKFTVNAVIKVAGKITIEVVYFNQQNNRFEYPKFSLKKKLGIAKVICKPPVLVPKTAQNSSPSRLGEMAHV